MPFTRTPASRPAPLQVTFRCKAPSLTAAQPVASSDTIQLEGMSSYEAATHCASLMAGQRMAATAAAAASGQGQGQRGPAAVPAGTPSRH
jgi:hypothetical protein